MTDRREVHADLVGATGLEPALEEAAERQLELLDDRVLRSRRLARVAHRHARAAPARASRPLTSVPVAFPAPGCTTRPAGLETTTMSSSAKRTSTTTLGSGSGRAFAASSGSADTSSVLPSCKRWLFATIRPSTSTAPS